MTEFDNSTSSVLSKLTVHSLKCPICRRCFEKDEEETCFEHFLDHFENSQHFLSDRSNLVFWLHNYSQVASEELISFKLPPLEDENMNTLTKPKMEAENYIESEKLPPQSCQICFESSMCEKNIDIHSFVHFKVKVPRIDSQLKCPLCPKYFCYEESCLIHIFTHVKELVTRTSPEIIPSFTQDPFQLVKKWILIFFLSCSSNRILTKYNLYKQRLNSPLLSKILLSEIEAIKDCKFCSKPVTSVFDLLDNHSNCTPSEAAKSAVCLLCNFKAPDMGILILHFFSDHIFCYCGYRGEDFQSFIDHSKKCVARKSGIQCPCCRVDNFVTIAGFRDHLEQTAKKRCCASILKKNGWRCVLCNSQSSNYDIFHHMFSKHVHCSCGYKNQDPKLFFKHTEKCVLKKTVLCPMCCKMNCSSEAQLKQHVSWCLPWKKSDQKFTHVEIQNNNLNRALKRKSSRLSLGSSTKNAKFSFMLNCFNHASQ